MIEAFYEEGLCWLKRGITKEQVALMETHVTDRYNLIINTIRAKGLQQVLDEKVRPFSCIRECSGATLWTGLC